MTIIIYMVLLLGAEPYPHFALLDSFDTMTECIAKIKEVDLTPKQKQQLACLTVVTSPMSDPL